MRESVWRFCLVCGVVSLCATSSWAVGPVYSLWVTGVYEQEFDGGLGEWVWLSKCDEHICPTQELPRVCSATRVECITNDDCVGQGNCVSIAGPGDLISIEVYLEGWDQNPSIGACDDWDQTPGCTVGDDATCAALGSSNGKGRHCTLTYTPCDNDGNCTDPSTCDPDVCRPDPLATTFQWYFDASSFWNYPDPGPDPGLEHADISCLYDEDCWCSFDLACSGGPLIQCTCAQACGENETCPDLSTIYFDWGRPDWIFANFLAIMGFNTATPNRQAGATLRGSSGIIEYDPGPPAREPPYYVGTFMLRVREQNNCGTFRIDFDDAGVKTFVQDPNGFYIEPLAVSPATINLLDFCVEEDKVCNEPADVCHKQWCNPCSAICEEHPDVGATCDDGELCTGTVSGDKCDESGQCVGRDKVCFQGEFCDPDTGECVPGECEWPQDIIRVTPASCAIDARQPHMPESSSDLHGWDEWVIEVDEECLPSSENFAPADFRLSVVPPGGIVPPVSRVITNDFARRITVRLDDPIDAGKWTCLELLDPDVEPPDPPVVVAKWCLGYLPGDVDWSRTSEGLDIDVLIDVLDGVQVLPDHSTDINRSGVKTNGADLLRLIDLLNGAMTYDPWMGETLERCPG